MSGGRNGKEERMRLAQFQVRKFRNIIDSGLINVETDVTCLVRMMRQENPLCSPRSAD
jgi:hypothetical protein